MSTEAKHTPGPWRSCGADREGGCCCGQVWSIPADMPVATANDKWGDGPDNWYGSIGRDEQVANARLIAAAPDLLEALKTIAAYPVASLYPDGPCIHRDDMKEVLAAIKNAEEAQPLSTHQAV